jgi:signal transduction histidine kinase
MRRSHLLFGLALLLGLCSAMVRERPPEQRLQDAAEVLQARIDEASKELNEEAHAALELAISADSDRLWRTISPSGPDDIRIHRGGQLLLWTGRAPISGTALDTSSAAHLDLPDGTYLRVLAIRDGYRADILRRVWFDPPFENQYLKRHFDKGFALGNGVMADAGPGQGPLVHDPAGKRMLRLFWADAGAQPGPRSWTSLILAFLAIGTGVVALWLSLLRIPGRPWLSIGLFVAILLGARWATLVHGPFMALASFPLFDPSLFAASFFMPSLGDLLINAAILLCLALFLQRVLKEVGPPQRPRMAAAIALGLLLLAAEGVDLVMIALVHDSSVSLDLFHVQDLDAYSGIALLAIASLLGAWCLLADALVRLLVPAPPGRWSYGLLVAGTVLLIGIHHAAGNYDLVLALWPMPVIYLVGRLRRRPGSAPALVLIAVLALFTAHVLNRQTFKRVELDRAALAETATTRQDPVIELLFHEAERNLVKDPQVAAWLRDGRPCTAMDLDRLIRQAFFTGYWDRYDLRLHLLSADSSRYCSTSPDAPTTGRSIIDRFEQGVPVAQDGDLRITDRPGEDALYLGRVPLHGSTLFVEVLPRLVSDGLGFPDLLLAGDRSVQHRFDHFARARYERGVLTASSGDHVFPVNWRWPVPPTGLKYVVDGYDFLAEGDPQAGLIVLGTRVPSQLDQVTTFSYLFLFFCLIAAATGLARIILGIGGHFDLGLRGKVRAGILAFAIISLGLFAFGIRKLLQTRSVERSAQTLNDRSRGVIAELRENIPEDDVLGPALKPYLDYFLGRLSNVFLTDLTLYSPDGLLLATSREQVFNTGLLGPRMDPTAYRKLAIDGDGSFIHGEHIGTATFSTAYMSLRNDRGVVKAYLALPYFARQGEVDRERAASYAAMVNLFALLFLMSVLAAALITNWTTRPLQLLRRGLERIGLGTRNEPIPYHGNDELGQLVEVYNRKVEELRISAEKLARSERESAWREMARQVAHEIKNPLTPMKLNIQHFQRSWSPEAPDAKERLDQLSKSLVDQIDALSHIADEFTHFAQMPPARPVDLDLGEVAQRAVALYAQQPGTTVELEGEEALTVHIEPDHFLRILNNLIKNALQAIPPEREGRVRILLKRADDEAVMEVRDNGEGISEEWRERIFTPNFTTKSSGMGLGLSMVQRMVEHAGGRVWFETEVGVGTSFFVALPSKHAPDTFADNDPLIQ